jgi:WD40 repeat protein
VLLQQIGEGGMGEVWVAKQTEPVKRKVAIKLIKAGMDSKAVLTRFEQERQALALMEHPHIAKVFDGGLTEDRRPFFVMELVNGLPLNGFCDEAKLGIRERLELFTPICQAVQHAHQKGIIHRDLKPSNILVTIIDGKPIPKVIDFGVAKATAGRLTDESLSTLFGTVVGTLEYMSPEQAGFSGTDIDTRSDIYSLGVILYELLTGLHPIDAQRLQRAALTEVIRIIREEEPSKPSTRLSADASLPSLAAIRQTEPKRLMTLLRGELDWVVMKCLDKQRDRRYQTAGDLSRDIQHYLTDEPVEARPPSTLYRLRKFVRRHRGQVVAASLLTIAVLALAGTMVAGGMYARAEKERMAEAEASHLANEQRQLAEHLQRLAVSAAQEAAAAAQEAAASKEQVRQVLYAADIQGAWNHWDANRPAQMREVLQRHMPAAGDSDYRGFEWYYLWRLANSSRQILRGHAQPIHTLTFAGSATVLLSGDLEYQYRRPGTVRKWNLDSDGGPLTLFTQSVDTERDNYYPGIRVVTASPDGTQCAFVDGPVVRLVEVGTGKPLRVLEPFPDTCRAVAFAPDGRHVAVGDYAGHVTLWDSQTGEKTATFERHNLPVLCLSFSPDGTQLAAGGGDESAPTWSQLLHGELRLWNVADGRLLGQCAAVRSMLQDVHFNAQGTLIAAASLEGTVVLWDVNRLEGGRILRGHTGPVNAVRWLPAGRYLASSGDDGLVLLWDVGREQGNRVYKGHQGAVTALAVSPDGRVFASAGRDATIQLWDPSVDPLRTMISDFPWAISKVTFSADGRRLVVSDYRQVTVCDTERFDKRNVLSIDHWVFDTDVSPDGRLIATAGNRGTDGQEPGVVKLWDVESGQIQRTLDPGMHATQTVAFSADGQRLACRGRVGSRDQARSAVLVWDVTHDRQLFRRDHAVAFDFDPEGTSIALAGRDGVSIARLDKDAASERTVVDRPCQAVLYSPDGQSLAILDADGQLSVWSLADARERPLGQAHQGIAFAPNGQRIAACGESQTHVWDVASGQKVLTIPHFAEHLLFTRDGRTIVTAGREIHLWQADTGLELLNLGTYEPAGVNSLAISPDGLNLAVGGGYRDEHAGVWVWLAPPSAAEAERE